MSFCKEALSYRDKGYSVIPIPPKQKKPPLVSWTRVQSKRATKRQITDWWKELPDANVGIVFGALSGLVVIDCDSEDAARKGAKIISPPVCLKAHPKRKENLKYGPFHLSR